MINNVLLETPVLYEEGRLTLQLNQVISVDIPPEEAQRKVNNYVHLEISTQMHAETPAFVVGNNAVWRVPIHLTFPSFGDVGLIGHIDVDPVTGDIKLSPPKLEMLTQNAENIAISYPTNLPGSSI